MSMMQQSFKVKLVVGGILLTAIPLLIISVIVFYQNNQMMKTVTDESVKAARIDLDHTVQNLYAMCLMLPAGGDAAAEESEGLYEDNQDRDDGVCVRSRLKGQLHRFYGREA